MLPMPDELSAATLQRVEARLSELTKLITGNGGIGLAERVRDNAREIQHLRNSLEVQQHPGEDLGVTKARLRLFAEVMVALAAALSLAMQFLGG